MTKQYQVFFQNHGETQEHQLCGFKDLKQAIYRSNRYKREDAKVGVVRVYDIYSDIPNDVVYII